MQLNCNVIKKVPPLSFPYQPPPPFQGYLSFLAKFLVPPQVKIFLKDPTPIPPLIGGGSNYAVN